MIFLGDTYDVIKQSFLRWLTDFGLWAVHPIFSENVSPEDAKKYSALLGARLISTDILTAKTNRSDYFRTAMTCTDHLFLDPDTGIRMNANNGVNKQSYIFIEELINISRRSSDLLTIVYDQSFNRGNELQELKDKMEVLKSSGIYCSAYVSHTKFILLSCNHDLIKNAMSTVLKESRLPADRFI